jgi:hypothetical protein
MVQFRMAAETRIVTTDFDDLLDERPLRRTRRGKKAPVFLGDLHRLITRGLPDLHDEAGVLDVRGLATKIGVSHAAIYKWFAQDRIPSKRVLPIITLSRAQGSATKDHKPLEKDDFWKFITS